ncbi:hypothetical protein E2C01_034322 [Portunus trituberculatus]|uniref:Uncharacterized protein n=1 Tax=Portunus trituberculatus TaxID=210409 RepID=A0A5B7F5X2_PORTR|nr:hypothetical protein [Portunus trituberculatus]
MVTYAFWYSESCSHVRPGCQNSSIFPVIVRSGVSENFGYGVNEGCEGRAKVPGTRQGCVLQYLLKYTCALFIEMCRLTTCTYDASRELVLATNISLSPTHPRLGLAGALGRPHHRRHHRCCCYDTRHYHHQYFNRLTAVTLHLLQ